MVLLGSTAVEASEVKIATADRAGVRDWNDAFGQMLQLGELRLKQTHKDPLMSGRRHERLAQYYASVPVWEGEVVRQIDEKGAVVSVFGAIHDGIRVDPKPSLTLAQAKAAIEKASGAHLGQKIVPKLVILPERNGTYTLAFTATAATVADVRRYFVDAHTGGIARSYSVMERQATPAVGLGTGVLSDKEKLSDASFESVFLAVDLLRPATILTYNMDGQLSVVLDLLNGVSTPPSTDLASNGDNLNWTDGAVVDGHVYTGFFYDYFYKRFGRQSWDDNNIRLPLLVHSVKQQFFSVEPADIVTGFYLNSFFCCQEVGGYVVFGEGTPQGDLVNSQQYLPLAGALDLVGHEMTHGMTANASALDDELLEAGSLDESFSDQMGISMRFFFRPSTADYRVGEEVIQGVGGAPNGIRDMGNPGLFGDPDNVQAAKPQNLTTHSMAGIPNQAFYLAIEGGRNRTSGIAVQGVGGGNREQIEKVFYRAFQFMLAPTADFHAAALACETSAQDLYGAGSPADQAVTQAWTAVGVLP